MSDRSHDGQDGTAPLWTLRRAGGDRLECVVVTNNDGVCAVRVRRDGQERFVQVFTSSRDAVRWAHDLEREFLRDGWQRSAP